VGERRGRRTLDWDRDTATSSFHSWSSRASEEQIAIQQIANDYYAAAAEARRKRDEEALERQRAEDAASRARANAQRWSE